MAIGILGGTFDPVHVGHLVVAEEVRNQLNLAEVLFVPAGQPWLKADVSISAVEHRVEMVRLALADKPYFKLSMVEVEREGLSYTVDTLGEIKDQLGARSELLFILGWDNLAQLPQWREPSRIVRLCRLVGVPRVGYPVPDLNSLDAVIPGLSHRVILLDKPEMDISASVIRERVTLGLSISSMISKGVAEYIKQQKLYVK